MISPSLLTISGNSSGNSFLFNNELDIIHSSIFFGGLGKIGATGSSGFEIFNQ